MNYIRKISEPQEWIVKIIPILFVICSVMHFLYKLSSNNPVIGAFAPVNESIWEHSKMVILPIICCWSFYYLFNYKKGKINSKRWFAGALTALIVSLILIPFLYYFYTEAFGVELLIVDIIILLVAITIGQLLGLHIYKNSKGINLNISLSIILLIILVFIIFTFHPPQLPIFIDNTTGKYGMN